MADYGLSGRLRSEGLEVMESVPGDGNCLFHAVARHLEGKPSAAEVRRKVVSWLHSNPYVDGEHIKNWLPGATESAWESYLRTMTMDGTWGDEIVLQAVANTFGREVCVISNRHGNRRISYRPKGFKFGGGDTVFLGFSYSHYTPLCRAGSARDSARNRRSTSSDTATSSDRYSSYSSSSFRRGQTDTDSSASSYTSRTRRASESTREPWSRSSSLRSTGSSSSSSSESSRSSSRQEDTRASRSAIGRSVSYDTGYSGNYGRTLSSSSSSYSTYTPESSRLSTSYTRSLNLTAGIGGPLLGYSRSTSLRNSSLNSNYRSTSSSGLSNYSSVYRPRYVPSSTSTYSYKTTAL
ncbi:Hypp3856 [Branchiostoma lanceolatum]|uniref:Hypp3856 protein n=1 Tax=Branchiostoma lanceolatum TaxID=7740 RepID=A0A8K0A558_BRALA|nr:Hypp3856 [Branchiostoma lanceolatum]